MKEKLTLCLLVFLVASCGYEGDGKYDTQGIWPFITYKLELPVFEFESGRELKYELSGYQSHGTSFLTVNLISEKPLSFHELDTIFELRVVGGINVTYFYRKSALNTHYKRMIGLGEASWPNEFEWSGIYRYSQPEINDRAVPFSLNATPRVSTAMTYMQALPTGNEKLEVFVKIGKVPSSFKNVKVQLGFISGWK